MALGYIFGVMGNIYGVMVDYINGVMGYEIV
jgi:hypothetical protein